MPLAAQILADAIGWHRRGDVQRAERAYREVLRLDPGNADAWHLLGVALHQQGNHGSALKYIKSALEINPRSSVYHGNLGAVHRALGNWSEASSALEQSLALNPQHVDGLLNLGACHETSGRPDDAARCYRRVLAIDADNVAALIRLGVVSQELRDVRTAISCYDRASRIEPDNVALLNDLGTLFKETCRLREAAEIFQTVISLKPKFAPAHTNLGNVRKEQKKLSDAILHYQRALQLNEGCVLTHANMGLVLQDLGRIDAACEHFERAAELDRSPSRQIRSALLLPPIVRSSFELRQWRDRLESRVEELISRGVTADPAREAVVPNFYAAYHGHNELELQRAVARLYRSSFRREKACASKGRARDGRIAIGFISRFFREHTIGHLMRGLVERLSRDRFHITVLADADANDALARTFRGTCDEFVPLPERLPDACAAVASRDLDMLFYADIGMDPLTTSLAHSRLARVQCTTWGHPVTTGIDAIDYFISSTFCEPEDAQEHYNEKLVLLNTLPTYYLRPRLEGPAFCRADFRLPESAHLYACPQSLFKLHPEFDAILGGILRRDRDGLVLLVSGRFPEWDDILRERFRRTLPDVWARINFLPRQSYDDFLRLYPLFDVTLDPLHFAGGNTSYEAMAFGIPVVTLPGPFLRGRVTYGLYRKMGMADCVVDDADDYVALAVKLGTDPAFRREIHEKILFRNACLFEDEQAVAEIEDFFVRAAETRAAGGAMPGEVRKEFATNAIPILKDVLRHATCPACGHHVAMSFYEGGRRPLATLQWPKSVHDAESMERLPLTFVRCIDCGHVYNADFDYSRVPYSDKPNLMFNKGSLWSEHLERVRELILECLPDSPTVVEIGCGEGHLLRALARACPRGRFIGFDPNAAIDVGDGAVEARTMLFNPAVHLAECRPDLIVSRHVLEHLMNPLGFVQALSFAASWENIATRLFIEVPCIDHVFALGRTSDFYYEHNSHFTSESLKRLLLRCATDVEMIGTGYNGEVVYGLATFHRQESQVAFARDALDFRRRAVDAVARARRELDQLAADGKCIALWGGTGKGAAWINQLELDRHRFPLVVDSDPDKRGTFVPGTGQEIRLSDELRQHPVEVIVIATPWRAADIVLEIERKGIHYERILLEHAGRLCDFFADDHPYRFGSSRSSAEAPPSSAAEPSAGVKSEAGGSFVVRLDGETRSVSRPHTPSSPSTVSAPRPWKIPSAPFIPQQPKADKPFS